MILGVGVILVGASVVEQHEAWCEHKRAEGWVQGDVKDADAKTHPALLPYEELPEEQKAKDHLFRAVIGSLAPFFGWEDKGLSVTLNGAELVLLGNGGRVVRDGIRVCG